MRKHLRNERCLQHLCDHEILGGTGHHIAGDPEAARGRMNPFVIA
jgi:hypothetical protein